MTVTKDTTHILTKPQEFQAAYLRAVEFFRKNPSVVSVGYGQKHSGGSYRDDLAIIVFVRQKKSADEIPPAEFIPESFEGYRTDVVVVPACTLTVVDNTHEYSTIQGGIQIEPRTRASGSEGTLACIVHGRGDANRENVFLLSCWHVLFGEIGGMVGDYVYHPFSPPNKPSNSLGPIQDGSIFANKAYTYLVNNVPTTTTHFLDAAVARINLDSVCCGSTCSQDFTATAPTIIDLAPAPNNTIADVRNLLLDPTIWGAGTPPVFQPFKVFKVGRTTGLTAGIVRRIDSVGSLPIDPLLPAPPPPAPPPPSFATPGQIEIDFDPTDPSSVGGVNAKGQLWFGAPGDSGSLVVDQQHRAIGILSSVAFTALPNGQSNPAVNSPAFVCHILPVLDHLNICISSAGLSPGSSSATDGTGRLPAATPLPAQSTLPTGQIVFTAQEGAASQQVAPSQATTTRPIGFCNTQPPKQLTEAEARHMRDLLAEFRDTRLGPELHAAFAEVRREIGFLVRNSRPVKVAWSRFKGPAYFAHVLNNLAGHTDSIPHEVQGVPRRALLVRMREVLIARGSNPLRDALERYGDELLEMFTREDCDNIEDCIAWLQERELA